MQYPFHDTLYAPAPHIAHALRAADDIVIASHANPDNDAVGSMYALARGLASVGKRTALCNATGVPEYLAWLPAPGPVYTAVEKVPFAPRLALVLDCASPERLGEHSVSGICALPTVNIDHHLDNPHFGSVANWVEPRMAATGQMTAAVLHALDVPLTGAIADALYVALSGDTGDFSFDNTSTAVLELVAHLVQQGLHIGVLRHSMDNQWTLGKMRLWGHALTHLTLHHEGRVALVVLSLANMAGCNARKEDSEGLVEHIRRLRGVEVAAFVREDTPHTCKISLRSHKGIDVQAMAARFGGGGHINAAGATLEMPLDAAVPATLGVVGVDAHARIG